jgi:hypothetical protein
MFLITISSSEQHGFKVHQRPPGARPAEPESCAFGGFYLASSERPSRVGDNLYRIVLMQGTGAVRIVVCLFPRRSLNTAGG